MRRYIGGVFALALIATGIASAGGSVGTQSAAAAPSSSEGRVLYQTYCSSCHGSNADGNGPASAALRHKPANLTLFALANGGVFPSAKLRRIVDGREVVSHGNPDMPVWGSAFKSAREGLDESAVQARIDAIVGYIESIQMRRG
jgi:mono/diheme cytochrome c family protein